MYIEHLVEIGREIKRILRKDGSWYLNLGDTFFGDSKVRTKGSEAFEQKGDEGYEDWLADNREVTGKARRSAESQAGIKAKCKLLMPYRVALALIDDGWICRNDITWFKPNTMPSSVKDRLTCQTERVFHFVKSRKYYYDLDAIRVPHKTGTPRADRDLKRMMAGRTQYKGKWAKGRDTQAAFVAGNPRGKNPGDVIGFRPEGVAPSTGQRAGYSKKLAENIYHPLGRNPGDFWPITTKPFPEAHFACASEDTECLTFHGWKQWHEIKRGELIATYNMEKQVVEFQPVWWVKAYDFDGELIHVGNRDLDILMTSNHRNVVKKRNGQERIVLAEKLAYSDRIRVRAPVQWIENKGIGRHLASLIGWIIAEGCYHGGGGIELYQKSGQHEKEIDFLLRELGIPHSKSVRRGIVEWYLRKSPWTEMIKRIAPDKRLNHFLISFPFDEARALFNAVMKGDGCKRGDGRRSNTMKDPANRDWFQILAFRLGYYPILGKDIYLTRREFIGIRGTNGKGKSVTRVRYKGKVWCPRTKNGTWVARRNGRILITGNTYPEALCERPIKSSCPPDGIVLDPMCGSGTTLVVAKKLGRRFIGIELNPDYVEMARRRLSKVEWPLEVFA
jgi:hypothetical protein